MNVCPYCDTKIEHDDLVLSELYDLDGFVIPCPYCGRMISVDVEIEEVSFELSRGESDA